jgi:hypothetical protein
MEFDQALEIVISKWPSEVDISEIKFHDNGGATIPELANHHDAVEEKCLELGEEVLAMDWSIFQYLLAQAKETHRRGVFVLSTKDIDIDRLRVLYNENCA